MGSFLIWTPYKLSAIQILFQGDRLLHSPKKSSTNKLNLYWLEWSLHEKCQLKLLLEPYDKNTKFLPRSYIYILSTLSISLQLLWFRPLSSLTHLKLPMSPASCALISALHYDPLLVRSITESWVQPPRQPQAALASLPVHLFPIVYFLTICASLTLGTCGVLYLLRKSQLLFYIPAIIVSWNALLILDLHPHLSLSIHNDSQSWNLSIPHRQVLLSTPSASPNKLMPCLSSKKNSDIWDSTLPWFCSTTPRSDY